VVEGKLLEKETMQRNLSLAREKAEDEIAKRQGKSVKMYNNITFRDEEHTKVKKIKPFIK
jgi:IMP dehydrogenase/GMP reductase